MTSGIFWISYIDETNDDANENVNNRINNNKTITSKSLKLVGSTRNNNNILGAEVIVPLKYLSNFWNSLDLPMIRN